MQHKHYTAEQNHHISRNPYFYSLFLGRPIQNRFICENPYQNPITETTIFATVAMPKDNNEQPATPKARKFMQPLYAGYFANIDLKPLFL